MWGVGSRGQGARRCARVGECVGIGQLEVSGAGMMRAWMDGWMDGWMDRWMDGWMDG